MFIRHFRAFCPFLYETPCMMILTKEIKEYNIFLKIVKNYVEMKNLTNIMSFDKFLRNKKIFWLYFRILLLNLSVFAYLHCGAEPDMLEIYTDFTLLSYCTFTGPPEHMGTWGLVPTIFWDLASHFQNCKLEVCTINHSKVTGVLLSPPCSKPFRRPCFSSNSVNFQWIFKIFFSPKSLWKIW